MDENFSHLPALPYGEAENSQPDEAGEKAPRGANSDKSKHLKFKKALAQQVLNEMKHWKQQKLNESKCYKLIKLYLGDPEFQNEDGVYLGYLFFSIAQKYSSAHSVRLLEMINQSNSFRFICNQAGTHWYGFFPNWLDSEAILKNFEGRNGLFSEMPMCGTPTAGEGTKSGAVADRETAVANRATEALASQATACSYYKLTTNVDQTMHVDIPPSEATLSACNNARAGGKRGMGVPVRTKEAPQQVLYPSGEAYFTELRGQGDSRTFLVEPELLRLMKTYGLSYKEAGVLFKKVVDHYLIPKFNRNPKLPILKKKSLDSWLRNIYRNEFYHREVSIYYQQCLPLFDQMRRAEIQEKQEAEQASERNHRPVSPYEWMTNTGQRCYRDPVDGVITLPAGAPPRPSNTCFWNHLDGCWNETEAAAPSSALPSAAVGTAWPGSGSADREEAMPSLEEVLAGWKDNGGE